MTEALWLDRYRDPVAIRRLGTFHLHHARLEGQAVVVAVSQGHVDPIRAEAVAAEAAALQGVLSGRLGFPPVADRATAGDVVALAFAFEARHDLWHLRAFLAEARQSLPAAGVAGLLLHLVDALAEAGAQVEPLRRLSPACVVFGPAGEVGFLAPGAELLAHQGAGLPTAAAPARARGAEATAHTVLGLGALLLGQSPPRSVPTELDSLRRAIAALCAPLAPDLGALEAVARGLPSLTAPQASDRLTARFHRERTLGFGRRGELSLARDDLLRQPVAIRWVTTRADTQTLERVLREVRLLRDVKHPHVVAGYDLVDAGERVGVVMEYVPGERFDAARAAGVDRRVLLVALVEVSEALEHLASRRVVHREVKPANILLHPERGAVLVDLSCARPLDGPDAELSMDNQRFGSFRYMAPELHANRPVPASDVYSLAMVAAELLCEAEPLPNHPGIDMALQALRAAQVPEEAASVVAAGLAFEPTARPSPRALGRALARLVAPGSTLRVREDFGMVQLGAVSIDLRRRVPGRRLIRRLVEAHRAGVGQVALDDLFAAGWPEDLSIRIEAKTNRVYNAISTLRHMGLAEVIESDHEGYRLAAATRVVMVPSDPAGGADHSGGEQI